MPGQESIPLRPGAAEDARAIVERHFRPRGTRKLRAALAGMLDRLLDDRSWTPVTRYALDVRDGPVGDFLGRQVHIVTEHGGALDPFDLEDYLAVDGFVALERALTELTPEEVIGQIKASGLRGRGGAGFPSGRKWELVRRAPDDIKYIIGNGDEGDPGAFMDRMLLESYPFRVIEGMIIAAYAAGL